MVQTDNKTAKYLLEKGSLQTSIFWYEKTIGEVEKQQDRRRKTLEQLRDDLFKLEKEYYDS